jgi:phosphopantothenoylcysteine synthetase/decarboxylase
MGGHLILVASGAPLASRVVDIVADVRRLGWSATVVATQSALPWIDEDTGYAVHVGFRRPDQPKRVPEPDAVVVCPATFNTINKIAYGISDNYATGVICEAIGRGLPVAVFPMISDRLWRHPARAASFEVLSRAGVAVRSIFDGTPDVRPVVSGTGDAVVAAFRPEWVTAAIT